jgi:glutamate carboxypeptidase
MKAGLVLCLLVARALAQKVLNPGRDVIFLLTGDEEIGTEGGLPHLRETAVGCRAVLCLEPPLPGGAAKTFRKGVGVFRLRARGVSAHAGVEPEKGVSAILEISRQVVRLNEMNDRGHGTTVTVGTIRGGTASNVVPAEAEIEVDVRAVSTAEMAAVEEEICRMQPFDERCTLHVAGGMNRPPLERTPAVLDLYERLCRAAGEWGWAVGEGGTGGGSDGSFTAAMGIPTLDGLGVDGGGAHAQHEYVEIDDIPRRAALLCRLVETLD